MQADWGVYFEFMNGWLQNSMAKEFEWSKQPTNQLGVYDEQHAHTMMSY